MCRQLRIFHLLAVSVLAACASVTTYGFKPRQVGPGEYVFKLYYNVDGTDEKIDAKASEVVEKIRVENDFGTCSYTRGEMVPPWRNKEIEVNVVCEK